MNPPCKTTGLFLTPRGPYGRRLPERARKHLRASEDEIVDKEGVFLRPKIENFNPENKPNFSLDVGYAHRLGKYDETNPKYIPQEEVNRAANNPLNAQITQNAQFKTAAQGSQQQQVRPVYKANNKLAGSGYTLDQRGVPATLSGQITPKRADELDYPPLQAHPIAQSVSNKAKRAPK